MNPGEHAAMARVEERHWWYRGLRDCLERLLVRYGVQRSMHPKVLDAGCGTGANLELLGERLEPSYLGGFDRSREAVELTRSRAPGADVYVSDLCDPELHAEELDLIISMDVIYIPGFERARPGLQRLVGQLRPGGLMIWNLPAYDWLYSEHDVAIHTSERYTTRRVRHMLATLGLEIELLTYRVSLLFPAVVLARLPTILGPRPAADRARSDLHDPPGPWTNRALFPLLRAENAYIGRGGRFPFGTSVLAVGRR